MKVEKCKVIPKGTCRALVTTRGEKVDLPDLVIGSCDIDRRKCGCGGDLSKCRMGAGNWGVGTTLGL